MFNKNKVYYLKIDNTQDMYETKIMDDNIDINFMHAMIKVRDNIYRDIELTKVEPKQLVVGQDYYIIGKNDVNFQKTNIIEAPIYNKEKKSVSFRGRVFGDNKIHSKGIVNFFLPEGFLDMFIYTLKIIGKHND